MMEKMYGFFKEMHVSVEDIIAQGDKVMVRNIWSVTKHDDKNCNLKASCFGELKTKKLLKDGQL